MSRRTNRGTLALCALASVLAGCDDAAPGVGAVEVRVDESGIDVGLSAFRVIIDMEGPRTLGPNGSVVIEATPGHHTVNIGGVADNCSVQGGALQQVDVPKNDTVLVQFSSSCVVQ